MHTYSHIRVYKLTNRHINRVICDVFCAASLGFASRITVTIAASDDAHGVFQFSPKSLFVSGTEPEDGHSAVFLQVCILCSEGFVNHVMILFCCLVAGNAVYNTYLLFCPTRLIAPMVTSLL